MTYKTRLTMHEVYQFCTNVASPSQGDRFNTFRDFA